MESRDAIEILPSYITQALKEHGISDGEIKVCVKSDMTIDAVFMDAWIIITKESLVLLDGIVHKSGKKEVIK